MNHVIGYSRYPEVILVIVRVAMSVACGSSSSTMSLSSVTQLAYARAVPSAKWIRLVDAARKQPSVRQDVGEEIAEAVFRLLWPLQHPPATLLSYLRAALQESLLTPATFSLLLIRSSLFPCSVETLRSLCSLMLELPLPLFTAAFPTSLVPINLHTTASTSSPPMSQPTLALITPLIQVSLAVSDVKLTTVLTYFVGNLPASPPPLQVALAAAEFLPALQDQGAEPLHRTLIGVLATAGESTGIVAQAQDDSVAMVLDSQQAKPDIAEEAGPSLLLAGPVLVLVARALRGDPLSTFVSSAMEFPASNPRHVEILTIGFSLTSDMQALLHHVIEAAIRLVIGGGKKRNDAALCFAVSGLADLLQYWRNGSVKGRNPRPYPEGNLPDILGALFKDPALAALASTFDTRAKERFVQLLADADGDDDDGFLNEQNVRPLFVLVAESLVSRDLLSAADANGLGLSQNVDDGMDFTAMEESFAMRICRANRNQIPALVHRLLFSPALYAPFAKDVLDHLQQAHDVPPPENLLPILTLNPILLTIIAQHVSPSVLSSALITETIAASDDPSSRTEDPQGCLTRFGEGVVLNEVIESLFGLPEAFVMVEARRTKAMPELAGEEKTCLNGWVKALFGPDGIEDEVLLATSPASFLKLSSTLIQQSIAATMAGVIDLDTLRGGLSYYAQPLLSWCSGRVVCWLCEEIPRQGLLSAIHLDVLQTMVLSSGFPEPILRMTAPRIARLLRPGSGLESVFQSANIDTGGIAARLSSVGVMIEASDKVSTQGVNLPGQVRADLQTLLHPELSNAALVTLEKLEIYASQYGPKEAAQTVLSELSTSTAPAQLVHRLAVVALSGSDVEIAASAVHSLTPELLQRETYPTDNVRPTATLIAKALATDGRYLELGRDLIMMLQAYLAALSEGRTIANGLVAPLSKGETKALTERQQARIKAFMEAVLDVPEFVTLHGSSEALRTQLGRLH